jgi:hypothetical protein
MTDKATADPDQQRAEAFWQAYFETLDNAMIPADSRAAAFSPLREVTAFHCSDGFLFIFTKAATLFVRHRGTGRDVQKQMHFVLDPLGLNLAETAEHVDFGPITVTDVPVGGSAPANTFVPRLTFYRRGGAAKVSAEEGRRLALANLAEKHERSGGVISVDIKKP